MSNIKNKSITSQLKVKYEALESQKRLSKMVDTQQLNEIEEREDENEKIEDLDIYKKPQVLKGKVKEKEDTQQQKSDGELEMEELLKEEQAEDQIKKKRKKEITRQYQLQTQRNKMPYFAKYGQYGDVIKKKQLKQENSSQDKNQKETKSNGEKNIKEIKILDDIDLF